MLAIMGLGEESVQQIIDELPEDYLVNIANINAPDQIVVSGAVEFLDDVASRIKKAGGRRVIPLKVAGAFHSILMKPAEEELAQKIHEVEIHSPKIPIVSNVTANYVEDSDSIRRCLIQQLTSPVKWQASMELLIQDKVEKFYEIGPGRNLNGLLRRISREVKCISIGKLEDLNT